MIESCYLKKVPLLLLHWYRSRHLDVPDWWATIWWTATVTNGESERIWSIRFRSTIPMINRNGEVLESYSIVSMKTLWRWMYEMDEMQTHLITPIHTTIQLLCCMSWRRPCDSYEGEEHWLLDEFYRRTTTKKRELNYWIHSKEKSRRRSLRLSRMKAFYSDTFKNRTPMTITARTTNTTSMKKMIRCIFTMGLM